MLKLYQNQHSPFCLVPIYLEVKLDKSLKFGHHRLALFAFPTAEVTSDLRADAGAKIPDTDLLFLFNSRIGISLVLVALGLYILS